MYGQLAALSYLSQDDIIQQLRGTGYLLMYHDDYHSFFVGDGERILALRGTQLTDPLDLAADFSIAITNTTIGTTRFDMGSAMVERHRPTALTGHSLGGTLAHDLGLAYNLPSYGFNEGYGLPQQIKPKAEGKHKGLRARGDLVSALGPRDSHIDTDWGQVAEVLVKSTISRDPAPLLSFVFGQHSATHFTTDEADEQPYSLLQ